MSAEGFTNTFKLDDDVNQAKFDNKLEVLGEQNESILKPVKKINQTYSYNAKEAGNLCHQLKTRPISTIEEMSEHQLRQRMKAYVPKDFDLPDYDRVMFDKQMELEIVNITLTVHEEGDQSHSRHIIREQNQEGIFRRLMRELEEFAQ